jgi:hypothetical protein
VAAQHATLTLALTIKTAVTPITNSNQTNTTDSPPPTQTSAVQRLAIPAMSAIELVQGSRAGQEAEQEPESEPQRKWVALVSVAVLDKEDDRTQEIVLGTDVLLDLKDPPLPSYLVLHPSVSLDPRSNEEPLSAYILAAHRSGYILLQVVEGNRPDFFLCDTHSRTVTILPLVSSFLRTCQGLDICTHLSIGLIADPLRRGHYVVAQLQPPNSFYHPNRLLCYSTAERRWFVRHLTRETDHMCSPFSQNGVLAHEGRLWWIALAYGIFFCDPFTPDLRFPELCFLPLPADCQMDGYVVFEPHIRTLINQRRCVRPSEGKLRFVEIRGLAYDDVLIDEDDAPPGPANPTVGMWTLDDDPEGPDPWKLEYEVPFAEIWDNETYADAGLHPGEVPHVALVDPNDHCVVYFFQGSKLFGLDVLKKQVITCKECLIDRDQVIMFQSSRPIVDAWELSSPPPTLPGDDDDLSPEGKRAYGSWKS